MVSRQHAHARQVHHAELVGAMPVERAAVADEDMLVMQQVERELLVRVDVEAFDVDLREDVERRPSGLTAVMRDLLTWS